MYGERKGRKEAKEGDRERGRDRKRERRFGVSDSGSQKPNNLGTFNRRETEKFSYMSYLPLLYFFLFLLYYFVVFIHT